MIGPVGQDLVSAMASEDMELGGGGRWVCEEKYVLRGFKFFCGQMSAGSVRTVLYGLTTYFMGNT